MAELAAVDRARFNVVKPQATAQADVYAQLRAAILNAQFRPGQLISLRVLAEAFGVSAMPVREAASRLAAEGCLEIVNRKGLRVPTLDRRKAREILALRLQLEGQAAEEAAEKVTKPELLQLKGTEKRLIAALEGEDLHTVLNLNMQFHLQIYRAAHNQTLMDLIYILLLRYAPTLTIIAESVPRETSLAPWIDNTHTTIISALQSRDGRAARAALVLDIDTGSRLYWGEDGS